MNLDLAALRIGQRYDIFFGGLQGPAEIPQSAAAGSVVARLPAHRHARNSASCIFTSLDSILFGGIYDHIGGGFFRHGMDERWFEPAFEKMLYDQALMIDLCTDDLAVQPQRTVPPARARNRRPSCCAT